MMILGIVGIAIIAVLVLLLLWAVGVYNRLVALRNQVENTWSQVDVQLRRRFDLIPNVVESVKGYASHEKTIFEDVAQARARMMNAQGVDDAAQANTMLTQALKSLFAVAEAYPDLKANQNFLSLQQELSGTETQIAQAREVYNDAIMSFNTLIQMFPASIIAGMFAFKQMAYFPMEQEAREPVKVSFSQT